MFKVFISTLFCEENDFNLCCDMINKQQNVLITHDIIKNLPEKEAHIQQTKNWLNIKNTYDFFVKIDADTVLLQENTIQTICDRMFNEKINFLQYSLQDFLSDSPIYGLNSFDKNVNFHLNNDKLFCDRNFTKENLSVVIDKQIVGNHMFYCNDKQAFHFGVHRGLKEQNHILEKIKTINKTSYDKRRAYAIAGFKCSKNLNTKFDYQSKEFLKAFEDTQKSLGDL